MNRDKNDAGCLFLRKKPRKSAEKLQVFLHAAILLHYEIAGFVRFCGLEEEKTQYAVSCGFCD